MNSKWTSNQKRQTKTVSASEITSERDPSVRWYKWRENKWPSGEQYIYLFLLSHPFIYPPTPWHIPDTKTPKMMMMVRMDLKRKLGLVSGTGANQSYELIRSTQVTRFFLQRSPQAWFAFNGFSSMFKINLASCHVTRFGNQVLHVFNFKGSPRLLKISKKQIGFKRASPQLFSGFMKYISP